MPPQAAKWAETLSSTLTDLALPCRDDGPVAPRNCPLGGHDHVARGCQNVQQGSEELDAVHQSARRRRQHDADSRGMQERAPSTRTEKVGQILDTTARSTPGFYAASSWGGYAQSKGDAPSTAHPTIPDSPRWWAVTLPGGCSV